MNIGASVLIGSLIFVLTNLARSIRAKDTDAIATQLSAFAIGLGVVFLASAASVTSGYKFNGHALNNLGWASKAYVGLLASSLFGVVNTGFSAIDNTRSSKVADLVPPVNE